jgi:hypothetical protein
VVTVVTEWMTSRSNASHCAGVHSSGSRGLSRCWPTAGRLTAFPTITTSVRTMSLRTRPVTTCRLCGEPIGDTLVTLGRLLWIGDNGPWISTESVFHPECYTKWDGGKYPIHTNLALWRVCPWCARRWCRPRNYRPPSRQRVPAFCTDACRKATRRARDAAGVGGQCEGCRDTLPDGRSDRRFCSNACRQLAYRWRSYFAGAKGRVSRVEGGVDGGVDSDPR